MKLLVQPEDGIAPLVAAVKSAKKCIDILIFRMDWKELEAALKAAVGRGIAVRALIAHTNQGGAQNLRNLEMRFLEAGVAVMRTADDLVRYHGKMLIIDRRTLHLLSFNFVHMDIDHSRGFGIVTKSAKVVQEAVKLFEADTTRQTYTPGLNTFIVSPANARKQLSAFIKRARKQLLIYDPKINDPQIIRVLQDRAKAGVDVRILGSISRGTNLAVTRLATMRLHTRTIILDGQQAFVGSQSLRKMELDARREIGIIVRDKKVVNTLLTTFEKDWAATGFTDSHAAAKEDGAEPPPNKMTPKEARALAKELPPLTMTVKEAIKKAVRKSGNEALGHEEIASTVKSAVKKAVKQAVKEMVQEEEKG
ncbi:MAG: phosphatidylserine synthase [Acidobacteria bacterium]|nr:MAG: phosphatidylserine synthase [Acidobacteriota bacterium]